MKKRTRMSVFYIVYFACILLFLLGVHLALRVVRTYLADYESAQPQHEAQRVFDAYYSEGKYASLAPLAEKTVSPLETPEHLVQYLEEYTAGKTLSFSSITTGLDDTYKYIVKADDVKFSAFTLVKSGEKTPKGFDLYKLGSFDLYCKPSKTASVTVPRGYAVYVNGVLLGDAYLSGVEQEDISCRYMPEGVQGIVYTEYRTDALYYLPQSVEVFTPDGRAAEVESDGNGVYRAALLYNDTLKDEYSDYAIAAAEAISAYMQNDGSFTRAAAYIDPESELYINTRTTETYFVIPHSSYTFENVAASEFFRYDINTFSCRVSFTHVLKRIGSEDYRDYIDVTFFFRRCGDKFLIYDRYNH